MNVKKLFPTWNGDVPIDGRRIALWSKLVTEESGLAEIVRAFPFEQLEAKLDVLADHYHVGEEAIAFVEQVPAEARHAYLYALLLWQMGSLSARFTRTGLYPEFRTHYVDSFRRILDEIEAGTLAVGLREDTYLKDLAITRLEMVPALAQIIHPRHVLSLKSVLGWGPGAWAQIYGKCGGRRHFLELHTHEPMRESYFGLSGWDETYRLAAMILRRELKIRGLVGFSWHFDPQVPLFDPELSYLRHGPLMRGARFVRIGPDPAAAKAVVAASPALRQAYEWGRYIPVRYGIIWSRSDILRFYGQRPDLLTHGHGIV